METKQHNSFQRPSAFIACRAASLTMCKVTHAANGDSKKSTFVLSFIDHTVATAPDARRIVRLDKPARRACSRASYDSLTKVLCLTSSKDCNDGEERKDEQQMGSSAKKLRRSKLEFRMYYQQNTQLFLLGEFHGHARKHFWRRQTTKNERNNHVEDQKETQDPHKHFPLREKGGEEISNKRKNTAKKGSL